MEDENKAEEPVVPYQTKKITFFNSIEEMNEDRYRMLAALTYEQRMENLEKLRKQVYHASLLPDGSWPLLSRKLTIIKIDYEVCR